LESWTTTPSDVDVVVVCTVDVDAVHEACAQVSKLIDQPVSSTILPPQERKCDTVVVRHAQHRVADFVRR